MMPAVNASWRAHSAFTPAFTTTSKKLLTSPHVAVRRRRLLALARRVERFVGHFSPLPLVARTFINPSDDY
jgi:hypothetical protein